MRLVAASLWILLQPLALLSQDSTRAAPRDTSVRAMRLPRRQQVTAELERTAFADARARELLHRARSARMQQDSALRAYDAKTFMRLSIGMGIRRLGPQRLLLRSEQAARVRWNRDVGIWVEPTGRRSAFPMGTADVDMVNATPIPYFPGRESLWIPASEMAVAKAEVDENDLIHPLATGAEAYYRYETGDSLSIRLPDGRVVGLRELRIIARRPQWRAFVGSFWFDVERGGLVRAAYRMSADLEFWAEATEEQKKQIVEWEERARTDTGKAAELARERAKALKDDMGEMKLGKAIFSPARARLSAVTVEYGLYEGRFWLPKLNVAEGDMVAGFMRIPLKWEESFRYNSVNARDSLPPIPVPGTASLAADDTTYAESGDVMIGLNAGGNRQRRDTSLAARLAREDSAVTRWLARADSMLLRADSARARGDSLIEKSLRETSNWFRSRARQVTRRREGCARDSVYFAGINTRFDGALRMAIQMPCDSTKLAQSPDLPGSIYEPGEELFGTAERDQLLDKLGFGLQPGWGPQRPDFHTGLDLLRYNKVEALSVGATLTSQLGMGYTARALGRIGVGDGVPNGELSLSRSNGRAEISLTGFHRLAVANDDFGAPLSLGASLWNLIDAGDEGFYYRTYGAELEGTRDAPGPLGGVAMSWRLFAERQRSAGTDANTQASLGNLLGSARFERNIDAQQLTTLGGAVDLSRSFGVNPRGFRFDTRMRLEGAAYDGADTTSENWYGRAMLDGTLSRPIGGFSMALTAAGGYSEGSLPIQRAFYVGGLHTVRGQFARLDGDGGGRVGDAFWLGRTEIGTSSFAFRPSLFLDVGWAGPRTNIARPYKPLSGVGFGLSLLDGMVRLDLSRGLWPEKRFRFDAYLGSRF